mmetsp:Transcript_35995/g.56174  ORF Transcript_35995/g.56174 Transcript_35995/m.56174 type:complete len:143 (+) Transcript_35995:24-452(+)|eukprot:CAMPEP_0184314212 /NCGR_PEP_ID=MMETSP1049-20130417/72427_1 /TAXON_ID=77928 /ORGANISM="Proteomonas sulcata, Strain CCMP704" /LENGTH=142 /DNA_ID=CAMNT_0026632019 /DNA_START=33 /DNA_END=461 /DNA_ORIENTATION=-
MTSLQALVAQKAVLEKELTELEKEIFELEGSYLEDTSASGNVLKGWDGYFQSLAQQRSGPRQVKVKNSERIFSRSSVSAPKGADQDDDPAPAPTGGGGSSNSRKDQNKSRRSDGGRNKDSKLGRAKLGRKRRNDDESEEEED